MVERDQIRYADSDGLQIAYQVVGRGGVDLVYVPGLANHIEGTWDVPELSRFAERLASFSRFILFDKRGSGLSDRMPEDRRSTIEERMHDVVAVLDAVGSSSAVLIGTADGAPVAMMAAAAYPERVEGMVLWQSSARMLEDSDYPIGLPASSVELSAEAIAAFWGNDDDPGLAVMAPSVARDPRWRTSMARLQRRACTPGEAARYWTLNMQIDVRSILSAIRVPTLVLHTANDGVFPAAQGRYVAEHIADAKYVEIAGTDHFGFAETGERLADEIQEFVTGRAPQSVDERRLASVLITDIVSSTERVAEIGDGRWRSLLEEHDRLLDAQIRRHQGRLVKLTGDGCLAVFDGPRQALLCAQAILAAAAPLGLELRVGVHTGEIEHRGDDIAGMGVHITARVGALANGGEIVVTRTVRDLVAGSTLTFESLGEHTLKGIDEPWHLYRLVSKGT